MIEEDQSHLCSNYRPEVFNDIIDFSASNYGYDTHMNLCDLLDDYFIKEL